MYKNFWGSKEEWREDVNTSLNYILHCVEKNANFVSFLYFRLCMQIGIGAQYFHKQSDSGV